MQRPPAAGEQADRRAKPDSLGSHLSSRVVTCEKAQQHRDAFVLDQQTPANCSPCLVCRGWGAREDACMDDVRTHAFLSSLRVSELRVRD